MPVLSMFYGIIVRMYFNDHNPPHFHVEYQDDEAIISLDGELIEGHLPKKQLRLVQAWAELRREELEANWKLTKNREGHFKIDPLK